MQTGEVAEAVAAVATRGSEQSVLEAVTAACRELAAGTYSAALLMGPDGAPSAMAHTGMTDAQVAGVPHLPRPVGLIGKVLGGQTLRLTQMAEHPDSVGFPAEHVPMAAMLGLPITVDWQVLGGLYLTRRPDQPPFDDDDVAVARALASQAGTTVSALRDRAASRALIEAVGLTRERANDPTRSPDAPSPVVRRLLATARTVLGLELTFLSRIEGRAQTFTTVDALPGAPALAEGTEIDAQQGYCLLMLRGAISPAVPDVRTHPVLGGMPVTRDLSVGAYCGVPVRLPDGTLYGTLCGLHGSALPVPLTSTQLAAMTAIAGLLGARLAVELEDARVRRGQRDALLQSAHPGRRRVDLQPVVDPATGGTVGHEAVPRFTDRTGAPRRTEQVFAEAAALGLGVEFELTAARDALALLPRLAPDTYLSVPLSAAAVGDPAAAELFTGLPVDRIVVEVTGHGAPVGVRAATETLAVLRARGLRVAVDDTRAGVVDLQHLTRLRPDIVKLDAAFLRDVRLDPATRAVARAVVGYAAQTGAALVAEGPGSGDELADLRALCDELGQARLLVRPSAAGRLVPAAALS